MRTTSTRIEDKLTQRSHVSWGAILAGFVTALSAIFLLNLLGVGIGFASIDPLEESSPLEGLGIGTLIWWVMTNLIALFTGGMVAGRLAGHADKLDGAIHGVIAWGVYALLSLYLITAAIGGIFSGLTGAAGKILGGDQAKVIVDYQGAQKKGEESTTLGIDQVKKQILSVIQQGERLNILPDNTSGDAKELMNNPNVTASGIIGSLDVDEFVNDLQFDLDEEGNLKITTKGNDTYFQKDELKKYLSANTQLTQAEINGLMEKWERKIDKAVNAAEEAYREAKEKAIVYADQAAEAMAKFSTGAFFALLLGMAAAMIGGAVGADQLVVYEETVEVETPRRRAE